MKLRNLFARPKLIRTFEELQNSKEPIIAYREKPGHREGAGSLYQEALSAWVLCKLAGKSLACRPFQYLHHFQSSGGSLKEYLASWNSLLSPIGLHQNQDRFTEAVLEIENPKSMLDGLPEQHFNKAVNLLRASIWKSKNQNNKNSDCVVAIHIRNLNPYDEVRDQSGEAYGYFTENYGSSLNPDKNLQTLLRVQEFLLKEKNGLVEDNQKLVMQILSQGTLPGISVLEKRCLTKYFIDEHPADSFEKMLRADLLVMASSSFSYLASLLRNGPTLALRRFRHQLPLNCKICELF